MMYNVVIKGAVYRVQWSEAQRFLITLLTVAAGTLLAITAFQLD